MEYRNLYSELVGEGTVLLKVQNPLLSLLSITAAEAVADAFFHMKRRERQLAGAQRTDDAFLILIPTGIENEFQTICNELLTIPQDNFVAARVRTAGKDPRGTEDLHFSPLASAENLSLFFYGSSDVHVHTLPVYHIERSSFILTGLLVAQNSCIDSAKT